MIPERLRHPVVERLVPAVGWLQGYHRGWLRADVVAGIAAGLVVVPQAMAYATIAAQPVQVGLYTCMVPMAVYALTGGSRVLSVSTTSTIATLAASTLVGAGVVAAGTTAGDDAAADLATLVLLVGLVLVGARLLRIGSLVDNISEAIVVGIKVGVGLTVAAGQLPAALGIETTPDGSSFFEQLVPVVRHLGDAEPTTVLLSAVTIAVLLGIGRVLPTVPGPLVAVVGGILLVAVFGIDDDGVALIAEVPRGLPAPLLPDLDRVSALFPGAVAIAFMAYLETVSVARAVRRPGDPSIDNDQELTANGASAVTGAFFGALPPAGGFSQTAVNDRAGARTQVSSLTTVLLAVATALFLGPVLDDLPRATLAAIVIVAVLGLIKPSDFAFLARFDRLELFVAVLTAVVGLVAGLLVAVAVGVAANLLLVLRELNHAGTDELRALPDGSLVPAVVVPEIPPVPGLLVLRITAPVYTANARGIQAKVIDAVEATDPRPRVVVVDMTVVGQLTVTALTVGRELEQQLADRGVELWIAALPPRALAQAHEAPGWSRLDAAGRLHPTATAAVAAYRSRPAPSV